MQDPRIGTASGTGRIVAESDNAVVLVIEFHARSDNASSVYVGMSDVTSNNGREIPPGESFVLNFALPDVGAHRGSVLLSKFYTVIAGGDAVDWSAIIRLKAAA